MAENGNGKPRINIGDLLHVMQILVLLVSAGIAYEKFNEAVAQMGEQGIRLQRVEHYLSSKDPQYWRISRENQ